MVGLVCAVACAPLLVRFGYLTAGGLALDSAASGDLAALPEAVAYLEQAAGMGSPDATIQRHLARAYILAGEPRKAAASLEQARQLLPGSPLVAAELAMAYELAGDQQAAAPLWESLGQSPDRQLARADRAFAAGDFPDALRWYRGAAALRPELPPQAAFRRGVAAASAAAPDAAADLAEAEAAIPSLSAHPAGARILGRDLHWLSVQADALPAGSHVGETYSSPEGYLWWSGEAVAFVDVPAAGTYTLRASVRHEAPAPVQMAVGVDGRRMRELSLERGDGSWEVVSLAVRLMPGLHVVNLWFLNNATIDGDDRDAVVAWVEVVSTD